MASDMPMAAGGATRVTKTSIGTARIDPPPPKTPSANPIALLSASDRAMVVSTLGHPAGRTGGDGDVHQLRAGQPLFAGDPLGPALRTHARGSRSGWKGF